MTQPGTGNRQLIFAGAAPLRGEFRRGRPLQVVDEVGGTTEVTPPCLLSTIESGRAAFDASSSGENVGPAGLCKSGCSSHCATVVALSLFDAREERELLFRLLQ